MSSAKSETSDMEAERGQWSYKIDYMLSMIGFSVGLGNLWRFPYVCVKNGGGAFLIPYVICLILCGLPLFFLETTIGQFSGKGTTHVWEVCPLFKGLGYTMIISLNIFRTYYNIIIGWILYYLGNLFISPLPWTTCNNNWNSPSCVEDTASYWLNTSRVNDSGVYVHENRVSYWLNTSRVNGSGANDFLGNSTPVNASIFVNKSDVGTKVTALEEFWRNNVLEMSEGIHDIGHMNIHLLLCLAGSWLLVCLCIIKGVKSVGKVVYVTAVLPYILLAVLLVRGLTLDGASEGLIFYLRPDFSKIFTFQVWLTAGIQVFYSLGTSSGSIIAMGSFNKFNNNSLRDAFILTFVCEGTSIFAGLVTFSILGYLSNLYRVPIDQIFKSGPGLGFIIYPEALAQLPGEQIWSVLFFIMLLTVGLDSAFTGADAVVVAITDWWPVLRRYRIRIAMLFCALQFLCGLIFCTQAGIYIFQLVDWYAAFSLSLFGFIECIIFGWIYGAERFSRDLKLMIGRDLPVFLRICICFITPAFLAILFIGGILRYKPPTHGDYIYPDAAVVFGFIIALTPSIPILVCAVKVVIEAPGSTLKQKILHSLKPTPLWGPSDKDYQLHYNSNHPSYEGTFAEKLKLNVLGQ